MQSFARNTGTMLDAYDLLDAMKPKVRLNIVLIEDDARDALLFQEQLRRASFITPEVTHFTSLEAFFESNCDSPDVLVLDRFIQRVGLTEGRIRHVKARYPETGIIMYTGSIAPALRSIAVQEGAFAVVEKGSLSLTELELLIMTTAYVGSKITN